MLQESPTSIRQNIWLCSWGSHAPSNISDTKTRIALNKHNFCTLDLLISLSLSLSFVSIHSRLDHPPPSGGFLFVLFLLFNPNPPPKKIFPKYFQNQNFAINSSKFIPAANGEWACLKVHCRIIHSIWFNLIFILPFSLKGTHILKNGRALEASCVYSSPGHS